MLNDEHPPIFGTGRQSRDFTFVKNVVCANLLAVKAKKIKFGVFNVASGKDYTVLDLVKLLNKILGKNIKPLFLEKRAGDVLKTLADLTQIKKQLKFTPRTDFVQGLRLTLDYWRSR
jgi:UDP-glucose 4-epimerase